ncbi:MAG TPA: BON domain-containing protein [Pyrinomonadaceae bacterium]|nr:BON domain-containing protein [Pyrinomonadaceae bacterium]
MEPNEKTEQRRVVVHGPGQRSEVVTERTQTAPRESGLSTGTIAIIAILAVMAVGIIFYLVSNRNANESANRNANIDVASQANREQPPVIIQQPAPAQQAPVIIQQPAPAQQAPVIIQQPAQTSQRDSASDDANMQEVATKRLSEELDMTAVSVTISEARAVLTGTVNSEATKTRAERLVKAVRGMKSVDNKIVVSG